jgi:hypothetical protein
VVSPGSDPAKRAPAALAVVSNSLDVRAASLGRVRARPGLAIRRDAGPRHPCPGISLARPMVPTRPSHTRFRKRVCNQLRHHPTYPARGARSAWRKDVMRAIVFSALTDQERRRATSTGMRSQATASPGCKPAREQGATSTGPECTTVREAPRSGATQLSSRIAAGHHNEAGRERMPSSDAPGQAQCQLHVELITDGVRAARVMRRHRFIHVWPTGRVTVTYGRQGKSDVCVHGPEYAPAASRLERQAQRAPERSVRRYVTNRSTRCPSRSSVANGLAPPARSMLSRPPWMRSGTRSPSRRNRE